MILKRMISIILKTFRFFIKTDSKSIVYHSFPDVSDNSFALFIHIINHHPNYKNIWLIDDYSKRLQYKKLVLNFTSSLNYILIKKNSIRGLWYFFKSKYLVHTHGLFNKIILDSNQVNINLWHGMPLKKIGHLDNNKNVPKSDYLIATSEIFKIIMSDAFNIDINKVFLTGQPRNDFLSERKFNLFNLLNIPQMKNKNTILWMPTYRKSEIGDIRSDGRTDKMKDFFGNDSLYKLNKCLSKIETTCFVKLHPMDYMDINNFESYSNIYFINESHFIHKRITLYSVLGSIDLLLTDFSSIYIDYLLLDKPIGFVFSDFKEYFDSRGFVFDRPLDIMPGEVINSVEELQLFLNKLFVEKQDNFIEQRKSVKEKFHEDTSDFSKRVFNKLIQANA